MIQQLTLQNNVVDREQNAGTKYHPELYFQYVHSNKHKRARSELKHQAFDRLRCLNTSSVFGYVSDPSKWLLHHRSALGQANPKQGESDLVCTGESPQSFSCIVAWTLLIRFNISDSPSKKLEKMFC